MYTFIIVLIVIISVLLVLVVLSQKSKGGVSSQFGGSGGASQVVGAKKSGDLMEKITWGLAIALLVLSAATTFFMDKPNNEDYLKSVNEQKAKESTAPQPAPTGPVPGGNTSPTEESKPQPTE